MIEIITGIILGGILFGGKKSESPKCPHGFTYKHSWPMCDEYFNRIYKEKIK